jgi:hypothetical protein
MWDVHWCTCICLVIKRVDLEYIHIFKVYLSIHIYARTVWTMFFTLISFELHIAHFHLSLVEDGEFHFYEFVI